MNNLTPELIAKVKAAKSPEELIALAEENNVALTAEEAKTYFEQLHTNAAVSDDELDAVAGGGAICDALADFFNSRSTKNDSSCSNCDAKIEKFEKPVIHPIITPLPFDLGDKKKVEFL